MPTDRERRLALNEAAFRVANERMRDWPERQGDEAPRALLLRVRRTPGCHEHVAARGSASTRRVRADPHRFIIVPGHEIPDIETVVERRDRYHVIEKDDDVRPITEATDPRAAERRSGLEDARGEHGGVARGVDADAGHRHARRHLGDREQRVEAAGDRAGRGERARR